MAKRDRDSEAPPPEMIATSAATDAARASAPAYMVEESYGELSVIDRRPAAMVSTGLGVLSGLILASVVARGDPDGVKTAGALAVGAGAVILRLWPPTPRPKRKLLTYSATVTRINGVGEVAPPEAFRNANRMARDMNVDTRGEQRRRAARDSASRQLEKALEANYAFNSARSTAWPFRGDFVRSKAPLHESAPEVLIYGLPGTFALILESVRKLDAVRERAAMVAKNLGAHAYEGSRQTGQRGQTLLPTLVFSARPLHLQQIAELGLRPLRAQG